MPYRSSVHADALLHYVMLMSRTNYFEVEEIMPILHFMAKAAATEPQEHRSKLHIQLRRVGANLETRGSHYRAKAMAILDWLDTKPFGNFMYNIYA